MKDIGINGNGVKVKRLIELENALLDSQERLSAFETTNEVLRSELTKMAGQSDVNKLQKQIDEMYKFVHRHLDPTMALLDEISKISEAEKYLEQEREKLQHYFFSKINSGVT